MPKKKKYVYAIKKNGNIMCIIRANTQSEAQAELEKLIAQDYMKRNGIYLVKMGKRETKKKKKKC